MFGVRWRWDASISLALPRFRNGKKIPPQIARMNAEDLLASVFPDQVACAENLPGEIEVPDHPLVRQTIRDCLEDAMDVEGFERLLQALESGQIQVVARDLTEPSPLALEVLNARPYAYLDDAPLEERRTQAVMSRRWLDPESASDIGKLDSAAIQRVREEAWPVANTADEMYDALMVAGYIKDSEVAAHWPALLKELGDRAVKQGSAWFALERKDDDPLEILASRLEVLGPVGAHQLDIPEAETALVALEGQGRVLRGRFTPESKDIEWCDRRLLARIHRYTLNKLRAEIEPVSAADFMRFLLHWQHVAGEDQVKGADGLMAVVEQLEGFELAAAAWENDVLPARVADYEPEQIDRLCLSGRVAWGRLTPGSKAPLRSSPIAVIPREHLAQWGVEADPSMELSSEAKAVREALEKRGASFFHELTASTSLLPSFVERGLAELAGAGIATADSFAGLRALLAPQEKRKALVETAGRWSLLKPVHNDDVEAIARALLKRYGVVFRVLLQRESHLPPWRDLVRVYRRLEARGEIRGGRFVAGFGGEQFAASDAVGRLRAIRKSEKTGELVVLSAADPLNLVGILTPEARVAAIYRSRILFQDGLPIAAVEAGQVRVLAKSNLEEPQMRTLLARRSLRHPLRSHLRTPTPREATRLVTARERLKAFRL